MNRRNFIETTGAAAATALIAQTALAQKADGDSKTAAMLLYPEFTALDLVGPFQVLSAVKGLDVKLVWKTKDIVTSDAGLAVMPHFSFKDCPSELAVLFVPGGTRGTLNAMADKEILDFLRSRSQKAQYITSVCTGSLVLGAAGLLKGYKATSHWVARDVLSILGAEPVDARVVTDRNRITGGGVTAGIDFGLELAAKLNGEEQAKAIQLALEYDPQPPFKTGSPKGAGEAMTGRARERFAGFVKKAKAAAEKAKAEW